MNIKIKKASGVTEDFNPGKLIESLVRSGASRENAEEVLAKVIPDISPYSSTKKIYRLAHKYLRQYNRSSVLRYSLKKALMRLGPTGYPFERYIGEIFRHYGYKVRVGVILPGKCVQHEVDVFAERGREIALIECKYRNNSVSAPDVKVAMYFHSRFRDLQSLMKTQYPGRSFSGWLVTNTRFTGDAIKYANCCKLKLVSWRWPEKMSLEKMIEGEKLYPVTVMAGLNSRHLRKLFENKIVLMSELARLEEPDIKEVLSISDRRAKIIKKQAEQLCFC